MTVSISKMSVQYYLDQVIAGDAATLGTGTRDITRYYTAAGAPPGRWLGSGTTSLGLGIEQRVTSRAARRLLQDSKHPLTDEPLGRAPMAPQQAPAGAKTAAGKPAAADRRAVAGFDLTFSVPKSVSVLWAMADEDTKAAVHTAHRAAMDQTLSWLEDRVIQTRSGHAGVAKVPTRGLIATAFDHWDSRAGDPQLHTHVVIANRVQRLADDAWVTLDSVSLHKSVVAASERFNGLLFDELARSLGTQAEIRGGPGTDGSTKNTRIELAGIPDELIDEFSTRSRAIEVETDRLIATWTQEHGAPPAPADLLRLRQQATLSTRQPKDHETLASLEEKSLDWQTRARDLGQQPETVLHAALDRQPTIVTADDLQADTRDAIRDRVLSSVSAQRSTFSRANVHAEVSRVLAAVRCHNPAERDRLLDQVTDHTLDAAVRLTPTRFHTTEENHPGLRTDNDHAFNDPHAYTTGDHLSAEQRLIAAAMNTAGPTITDTEAAERILDSVTVGDGHALAEDQRAAALKIATAQQSLTTLIGPAGTGKTTCLSALREIWEHEHGTGSIVGLAPSAVAAAVLGKEIDVPTDNVAKWLWESEGRGAEQRYAKLDAAQQQKAQLLTQITDRPTEDQQRVLRRLDATITAAEAETDKYTMRPGQLVIVDEASMAGTASLDRLRAQAEVAGAKLVAVGDPSQLGAIDAGGMLGWIERHRDNPDVTAATLTSVWRFKNDWEANNSLALRRGEMTAVHKLIAEDRITQVTDPDGVEAEAFSRWAAARTEGSALLIAATQESVDRLNMRAQALRLEHSEVDHTATAPLSDDARAGVGDQILTRRNNRHVLDDQGDFIKNGDLLTVTAIHPDGSLEAARENGASLHLPRTVLDTTQLGYAATAYRCQGVTVDRAISAVDVDSTSREAFYVAMTRGKHSNVAVLPPPPQSEDAPDPWSMLYEQAPKTAVEQLSKIMARTETELTAHEVRDHAHGWDTDLGRLTSELEHTSRAIATRQVVSWVTGHHGPDALASWSNAPQWPAIVNAVAEGHDLPESPTANPRETLTAVAASPVGQSIPEHGILRRPAPETPLEQQTTAQLFNKIDERLAELRDQTARQPWRTQLLGEPESAVDAALVTRAILKWDHPEKMLPDKLPTDARAMAAIQAFEARATTHHQVPPPEQQPHSPQPDGGPHTPRPTPESPSM